MLVLKQILQTSAAQNKTVAPHITQSDPKYLKNDMQI